jgi:arylsulfatase A-like enzyme
MPSRVSFLTGQYPSTLGITHMAVPVPPETVTLAHILGQYGYFCANLGKLHFLPHANRDHRQPHPDYGFDQLEISDEPGVYEDAYRAWVRRVAPDQLDHLSVGLPPATAIWYETMGVRDSVKHPTAEGRFDFKGAIPFPGDEGVTHTAFVAERTIDFLARQSGERPFLGIAGFFAPHAPWVVPQRYLDLYDPAQLSLPDYPPDIDAQRSDDYLPDTQLRSARHGYYAMISEVDHHVGRILAQLDQQGLADNTIVLFTSDHGEWLGDHLRFGKGYPGDDAASRVPLIVRWPTGIAAPGRTERYIVEAVDVLPTLLECAGIQIPSQLQGESLAPILAGDDFSGRGSALMEHSGWKSLRTRQFRYVVDDEGREMLWDLEKDPGEYFDVQADPAYATVLFEHRRLLLQRLLEMERPLPRTWPY